MIEISDLQTALLDLLYEIKDSDINLIVGGGFGIYLKEEYVRQQRARTLLNEWPVPRTTNDLDLFLRPELLIHSAILKPMAEALERLGYGVVPGSEKYQFVKPGPEGAEAGSIKIDILTAPQSHFQGTGARTDERRVRPRPSVGIHAHPVNEASTLEEGLISMELSGTRSSGDSFSSGVFLPNPYTFLLMKLFAFKDRVQDADKEYGRYHALDLYTIMATTTEEEWGQAQEIRDRFKEDPYVLEAGRLVSEYFSTLENLGMLRLRESPYYRSRLQLDEFMSAFKELFPLIDEKQNLSK